MCGRFEISYSDNIFRGKNSIKNQKLKEGEIFPTDIVMSYIDIPEKEKIIPMYWGFSNGFMKSEIINVRTETVHEKKLFENSVLNRRCVIKSTGFYEWNKYENKAERGKFKLVFPNGEPMYLAGIYKFFNSEDTPRFSILTTDANEYMSDIHDRMPIVLKEDELETWFSLDYELLFNRLDTVLEKIPVSTPSQMSLFD